jgi:hypothetical protein
MVYHSDRQVNARNRPRPPAFDRNYIADLAINGYAHGTGMKPSSRAGEETTTLIAPKP